MCLPDYLYHAVPKDKVHLIIGREGTGLKALSSGNKGDTNKYLCMSGNETGATTLQRAASDVVLRVPKQHLVFGDWSQIGAGENEWRSKLGITKDVIEYRRNIPKLKNVPVRWYSSSHYPESLGPGYKA